MTKQKDLKRLIRARMEKTGESYTAARAHIVAKRSPPKAEYVELAGMSDEAVAAKTGHTWAEWVEVLDGIEAITLPHRDIAKWVGENHSFSGWWAQSVTVGYERIRGLRAVGQRREGNKPGTYDANKSKTFPVGIDRLFEAFISEDERARWLREPGVEVRTSKSNKSIGFNWPDGTRCMGWFTDKGPAKSSVQLQHSGLPNAEALPVMKKYWAGRLAALAAVFAED